MVISTDAFIRIFFLLLYVSVGVISYRLLLPRLSLTSNRLAIGMLLAQVLVILVALEIRRGRIGLRGVAMAFEL